MLAVRYFLEAHSDLGISFETEYELVVVAQPDWQQRLLLGWKPNRIQGESALLHSESEASGGLVVNSQPTGKF